MSIVHLIDGPKSGISLILGSSAAFKASSMQSDSQIHASHYPYSNCLPFLEFLPLECIILGSEAENMQTQITVSSS